MGVAIPDWDGPGTGFTITDAVAYIDTIEIIVEFPSPRCLPRKLRKMAGKRLRVRDATRPDRANLEIRHPYAMIIALSRPTTKELKLIPALSGDGYLVRRVDVACDYHTPPDDVENCGRYLERHGWQKWRGQTRQSNRTENVCYWSADASTTRNIAVYFDRPSRIDGTSCAHWEMRFVTAGACRRVGLHDLNTLIQGNDAVALLNRQAKLKGLDRSRFFKRTEEMARNTKRRHRRALENQTVEQVQRRVRGMIFAALQDKNSSPDETTIHTVPAQEIHDRVRPLRKALVEVRKWEDLSPNLRWLR